MINESDAFIEIDMSKIECKLITINHVQKYKNKFIITYFDDDGMSNEFVLHNNEQNIKENDKISICLHKEKNIVLKYLTKIGVSPLNTEEYKRQLNYIKDNEYPDIFELEVHKNLNLLNISKKGLTLYQITFFMAAFSFIFWVTMFIIKNRYEINVLLLFEFFLAITLLLVLLIRNKVYFICNKLKKINVESIKTLYADFDEYAATEINKLLK